MVTLMMRKGPLSSKSSNNRLRGTRHSMVKVVASEALVPETKMMIIKTASSARSLIILELIVLIYRRINQTKEASRRTTSEVNSGRVSWKHGMNLIIKTI